MRPHVPLALPLLAALFVWAGMVAGISFLEAPLKFTAPHITVPLGVGIGRVVFHALNKVEIVLAAVAGCCAVYLPLPRIVRGGLALLGTLVLLQTCWLLPALDARAEALLAGHAPPPNYQHWLYIATEATKLLALLGTGTLAYRALHPQPASTAPPSQPA